MDEESSSQGKPATTAGVPLLPGEADNGPGLGSSSVVLDSGRGQGEAGELQGHYEAGEGENFKGATPSNFSGHAAAFEVGNEPSNPSTQPQPEEAEAKLLSGHSKKTSPLLAVFPSPSPMGSAKSATSPKNLAFAPLLPSPTGSIKGRSKLRLSPSLGEGEKQEGEGEIVNEQPAISYLSPKGLVKGLPSPKGIMAMSAPFLQSPTGSSKGKWKSKKSEIIGEGEAQEDEIVDETSKMPESCLKQRSMKQRRRGVTDDDGSLNLLGHDSFRIQGDHEAHSPSRILPPTSPWGSERHESSFGSRSLFAPLENAHMSEGQIEEMFMVQEKDEALRRLFRGCVRENSAQKQVYARQKIMSDLSVSESTNWFNSPNPLVALFSRRQFVGYLAAICLFFLVCGGAGISEVSTDGRIRVRALRFTSLGRRDGGNVTTPGIARFGIIGDRGCILDFNFEGGVGEQEATVSSSGPTITARFHKALEIGGYFIVTSDGPPELDSTSYRLDGLVEDHGGDESKEDWGVIGGSHWSRNAWGEVSKRPGSSHHTEARNAAVSYALSLTWPRMLLSVAQPFALVFGCFVTVAFSVTKRYHDACTAWIATSVVKTLFLIASAVGYILEGDMNSVKMLSVVAAIDVIMLFVSWLFPKFVIEVTFVSNLSATISWFAFEIFFPRPMRILASPLTTRYLSSQYVYAISSLVSSVTLLIIKERVVRMMSREFIEYTAQFSAAWSELMEDMGEQGTLDDIKNLCNLMKLTSGSQTTLHQTKGVEGRKHSTRRRSSLVGRRPSLAGRRPSLGGVFATGEDQGGPGPHGQIIGTGSSPRVHSDLVAYGQGQGQRVRSFQQLHMAAKVLNPFLKKKVKDWAETSGGKFPLKAQYHDSVGTSSMYVRWDVAMVKENMLLKEKIGWAAVKDPVRAMKKAILCYNGDVSRLTDLCRQSIIFEHFIDLFTCLEDIASDPEVEVVRVVNRLDPSYSGDDTLGYRHIKINLRVTTKETRRLLLDSHICEVQLTVAELRQLVTEEEHARFLDFRKLKETRILQMFISLFAKSPSEVSTVEVNETFPYRPSSVFLSARSSTKMIRPPPNLHWCVVNLRDISRLNSAAVQSGANPPLDTSLATDLTQQWKTATDRRGSLMDRESYAPTSFGQSAGGLSGMEELLGSSGRLDPNGNGAALGSRRRFVTLLEESENVAWTPNASKDSLPILNQTNNNDKLSSNPGSQVALQSHITESKTMPSNKPQAGAVDTSKRTSLQDEAILSQEYRADADQPMVIVEQHFLRLMREVQSLDKNLNNWGHAMQGARWASSFYTATPLTTALCKRIPQAGAMLIGCAWLALAVYLSSVGLRNPHEKMVEMRTSRYYRFTHIETRGGGIPVAGSQVKWGPIFDTCLNTSKIQSDDKGMVVRFTDLRNGSSLMNITRAGMGSMQIGVDDMATVKGWVIYTLAGDPDDDPARFVIEESNDMVTWRKVMSSSWGWGPANEHMWRTERYEMTMTRSSPQTFIIDHTMYVLIMVVKAVLLSSGALLLGISGILKWYKLGHWAYTWTYIASAIMHWIVWNQADTELGLANAQFVRTAHAISGCASLLLCISVNVLKRHFVVAQTFASLILVALSVAIHEVFWRDTLTMILTILGDLIIISAMIFTMVQRQWILFTSNRLIALDKESYDAVWRTLQREDKRNANNLTMLANIIKNAGYDKHRPPPVQHMILDHETADESLKGFAAGATFDSSMSGPGPIVASPSAGGTNRGKLSVRRTMRILVSGSTNSGGDNQQNDDIDYMSHVMSLDQLMYQSNGLNPILRRKVQIWAQASKGLFPLVATEWMPALPKSNTRSVFLRSMSATGKIALRMRNKNRKKSEDHMRKYIRWDAISDDPMREMKIKWAKTKTPERCMQKLMRAYRGEVSRLVDITRQSIIFESIEDIVRCVSIIMMDPEIVIERIKNRFDVNYDSSQSAGYRDLALNLRIVSREAKDLGLHTHVCEVQLLNKQMAEMKSDNGHKRYVEFRDARAE